MDAPITRYGKVPVHGTHKLSIVYTNENAMMPGFLAELNGWLEGAKEEERFIGLDFEYTDNQKDVSVIQLCFKKNVLAFQWARYVSFGAFS